MTKGKMEKEKSKRKNQNAEENKIVRKGEGRRTEQ
jgi:hypothetical protein